MRTNLTLLLIFLILVAVLLLIGTCRQPVTEVKEVIKKDTVYLHSVDTVRSIPTLVKVIDHRVDSFVQYEVIENPITHEKYNDLVAACNNLYWECTKTNIYADTQKVSYGQVIINDTVTKNQLRGRSIITDFKIPLVTEYRQAPKKGSLYFGAGANYSLDTTLGLKASFLWITKNGKGFEIETGINNRSAIHVGFKYLIPLKN